MKKNTSKNLKALDQIKNVRTMFNLQDDKGNGNFTRNKPR